ncbi:ATP-binding protein [Psychrosphaera algicola]|uniref:histidine kinase n=1 Tax=Psychrosphaera algicola TaxID=3023714 RepID=A0ABT5FB85_9GAMM|nr:ATP-binding protein [Psychrosphaera sp. G1-22]MDC2888394.1 ATP-binding protein [Psychrosphaera sp. G1-22]
MQIIKNNQQVKPLIHAKFVFIALQLLAIIVSQQWLDYDFPYSVLYSIILAELIVNIGFYVKFQQTPSIRTTAYFSFVAVDIIFLSVLLYFTGGAANPFVSLLLLPIAIASVSLTQRWLLIVTFLSMSAYSTLLFSIDPHALHNMDLAQHLFGMWLNFLLSALVVVIIVVALIKAISRQDKIISQHREEQLRQEQLVSLGAAAAQFAHRLATPLGTAHLLAEELQEHSKIEDPTIILLDEQLATCRRHLVNFRDIAEKVRNNIKSPVSVFSLIEELKQEVQISFPLAKVTWNFEKQTTSRIVSEPVLLPALLNLIQNAVNASGENHSYKVIVNITTIDNFICLSVRDFGPSIKQETLLQLGVELVDSKHGLGMGVFLSHVTLEKLGGKLKLFNHPEIGAVAEVFLPIRDALDEQ